MARNIFVFQKFKKNVTVKIWGRGFEINMRLMNTNFTTEKSN